MIQIDPKKLSVISDTPIEKLALDNKVYLRLKDSGVNNVGDILRKSNYELLSIVRADQAAMDNIKKGIVNLVHNTNITAVVPNKIEIKTDRADSISSEKDDTLSGNKVELRQEAINYGTDPIRDHSTETSNDDPLDTSILDLDISSKAYYALRFSNLDTIREIISKSESELISKHRRLDFEKIDEIKKAIKEIAEQKGIAEMLKQYPLFRTDHIIGGTNNALSANTQNDNACVSLEDCIRAILTHRKVAGREWITAMTVYDTLKEEFPSVAEHSQLVDIRDILTTANWIEKNDFYYRIIEEAVVETKPAADSANQPTTLINEKDETDSEIVDISTEDIPKTSDAQPLATQNNNESNMLAGSIPPEQLELINHVPIEDLDLSVRSYNGLRRANIWYVADLATMTPGELLQIRNLGELSKNEIIDKLKQYLTRFCGIEAHNNPLKYENRLREKQESEAVQRTVVKGTIIYDIPISQLELSMRARNCLKQAGIKNISEIIYWGKEDFLKLRNMGVGSANEIIHRIQELYESGEIVAASTAEEREAALEEYYSSDTFKIQVSRAIDVALSEAGLKGLAFNDIRRKLAEPIEEKYIKPIIDGMLCDGSITCDNGRYKKVFPSILAAIEVLPGDRKQYIRGRLEGKTLEEIGKQAGVTRERVRQIIAKDLQALKKGSKSIRPVYWFSEDEYRYLYQNYYVSRADWLSTIGEPEYVFNYLQTVYKRGGRPLDLAVNDQLISDEIKHRIQAKVDENYIIIDNRRILKARKDIEDYVIYKFFRDEGSIDEFYDVYNSFLEESGIKDSSLYATDDVKRTRENRIAESKKVLWKQNRRLRYYDINGTDFQELLETLNLDQYENIELSTLKFMIDYPELMKEYDIRDEYELHNLLKKICNSSDYHEISFGRMPGITFGQFNRDEAVKDILFRLAPISQDELAEAISQKYGFRIASIKANWLGSIDEYYSNGEYHTEEEDDMPLTEEQLSEFNSVLTENFYFSNELTREYSRILGEKRSPSAYLLKRMGYKVHSEYVYRGASSATEYFANLLTKTEIVDLSQYGSKLHAIASFNQVNYTLREEYVILEFEPYKYISLSRLKSHGIEKKDIVTYCVDVKKFVGENNYFTIPWLRNKGFTSRLDDLGFDDFFYEAILALDPEVTSFIRRSENRKGSVLLKIGEEKGSKADFLVKIIEKEGSIDRDDLIRKCATEYNVFLTDNDLYNCLEDTALYYDSIMGKYYANYSLYFEEV